MSLPAGQQRVLNTIERTLQASEPHMASMFAIFARLNEGSEPVGAEPLRRRRRRGLQPGRAMYAAALIPVVFLMVVAGVLLGGSAHGLTTCGSGSAAFGGSPWVNRSSCQASGKTTPGSAPAGTVHGSAVSTGSTGLNGSTGSKDPKGAAVLSGTGLVADPCAAVALTVRAAAWTGVKPPAVPFQGPEGAVAGTQRSPAMCYK
jgi:Protein of unknown function (DUF3040)